MTTYLKYYFGLDGEKLYIDSITVKNNEAPILPKNFLKWYEYGDLGDPIVDENTLKRADLFWTIFSPRKVNFSIEEAKTKL